MSKQKKPRNKKYRPRMTYPNPILLNTTPEEIQRRLDRIEAGVSLRLKQIEDGTADGQTYIDVYDVFRAFYVHAVAFEDKDDLQALMIIGGTACCLCAQLQFKEKRAVPTSAVRPIALAVEACVEMMHNASIMELGKVFQIVDHTEKKLISVDENAGYFFSPSDRTKENLSIVGRRGMAVVNGKVRTGYVQHNEELDRFEWFSPLEETTIAIKENLLVVLAEPLKD